MSQLIVLRHLTTLHKSRFIAILQQQQQQQMQLHLARCRFQQQKTKKQSSSLERSTGGRDDGSVSTDVRPLGEKIKENTKTASYTAIIIAGISVTGIMFWAIFRELFSSSSPNNIYSDALERVKDDPRVQDAIGSPIKGFGEESRRGRRQHVAHTTFVRNGAPHMRMQFYVQGLRNKATVHLESRRTSTGRMEYRYLFVQLNHYPHTTIILEDNRAFDSSGTPNQVELNGSNLEFASYGNK